MHLGKLESRGCFSARCLLVGFMYLLMSCVCILMGSDFRAWATCHESGLARQFEVPKAALAVRQFGQAP